MMNPEAPVLGKSISTILNCCPIELNVSVPSGYVSYRVSTPLTVTGDPTGVETESKKALSLMGLPVLPGPGSFNSAVLKVKVMLAMFRLKLIIR
jgi:hypothetical protein